jgi:hypothetical protein
MTTKYIDHLTEDEPLSKTVTKQLWVCLSFLSPEGIRNCSVRGLKIRGVFETKDDADKHAEELRSVDPDFHVFVGEIGKWLPWDPDPNSIEDQRFKEKQLNDLMKGYKDNLEKTKRMQAQRKDDMLRQAASNEKQKGKENGKTRDKLRKELDRRNKEKEKEPEPEPVPKLLTDEELKIKNHEESFKKDEDLVKLEKECIDTKQKNLENTQNELVNLDKELEKMKALYEKLNN